MGSGQRTRVGAIRGDGRVSPCGACDRDGIVRCRHLVGSVHRGRRRTLASSAVSCSRCHLAIPGSSRSRARTGQASPRAAGRHGVGDPISTTQAGHLPHRDDRRSSGLGELGRSPWRGHPVDVLTRVPLQGAGRTRLHRDLHDGAALARPHEVAGLVRGDRAEPPLRGRGAGRCGASATLWPTLRLDPVASQGRLNRIPRSTPRSMSS